MDSQSDTAIARRLLVKKLVTEPQFEIWYRAVQLGETIRAISKDYPDNSPRTLFRWRNRTTSLIEEVQDLDRLIEEERRNLPEEDDPMRYDIAIHRGHDLDEVDNSTARKAVQRV